MNFTPFNWGTKANHQPLPFPRYEYKGGRTLETEAKTELKRWWSQLVWESEREFVSPYNLDECVRRLKALEERYHKERSSFFSIFRLHIRNIKDKGSYYSFEMDIHASKIILSAELIAQLIPQDEKTTQVNLRYGYALTSVIVLILILPAAYIFSIITTGVSPSDNIFGIFSIGLAVLFIQVSFSYGMKDHLYEEVRRELASDLKAVNPV